MATDAAARLGSARARRVAIYAIPATITLSWLVAVSAAGEVGRVASHWESTVTMIFGSFLAGSTPAGAVAFPVFTKVLDTPAEIARTFSLSIQAIGMTVAAAVILLARRTVEWRVIVIALPFGVAGLLTGLFLLGDPSEPFWGFTVSPTYANVTFTITLAAMSYVMLVMLRSSDKGAMRCPIWSTRVWLGVVLAAFVGSAITSLTGTGVNVMLFLFIVMMAGLHPRVGVPTSIAAMAVLSTGGFLTLSIVHGQFDLGFNGSGEIVLVGGGRSRRRSKQRATTFLVCGWRRFPWSSGVRRWERGSSTSFARTASSPSWVCSPSSRS